MLWVEVKRVSDEHGILWLVVSQCSFLYRESMKHFKLEVNEKNGFLHSTDSTGNKLKTSIQIASIFIVNCSVVELIILTSSRLS